VVVVSRCQVSSFIIIFFADCFSGGKEKAANVNETTASKKETCATAISQTCGRRERQKELGGKHLNSPVEKKQGMEEEEENEMAGRGRRREGRRSRRTEEKMSKRRRRDEQIRCGVCGTAGRMVGGKGKKWQSGAAVGGTGQRWGGGGSGGE
jgi:hypothetical protein